MYILNILIITLITFLFALVIVNKDK